MTLATVPLPYLGGIPKHKLRQVHPIPILHPLNKPLDRPVPQDILEPDVEPPFVRGNHARVRVDILHRELAPEVVREEETFGGKALAGLGRAEAHGECGGGGCVEGAWVRRVRRREGLSQWNGGELALAERDWQERVRTHGDDAVPTGEDRCGLIGHDRPETRLLEEVRPQR